MTNKIIFVLVAVIGITMIKVEAEALPIKRTVLCDDTDETCYTANMGGTQIPIEGTYISTTNEGPKGVTTCPSGNSVYTDIFIFGMGSVGDGVGYENVTGCYDPTDPLETYFWELSGFSTETDYDTWESNVFGN